MKLFLIDDHQIVIDGIKLMLEDCDVAVVGESNSAQDALASFDRLLPDLVITDISMPGMTGVEFSRHLKSRYPRVKLLVLSMFDHPSMISELIDSGISGFIIKNKGQSELIQAIKNIQRGGTYFTADLVLQLRDRLMQRTDETRLTQREIEIVKLLEEGLTSLQMADRLFISEKTIETHRRNILKKTDTHSTIQLLQYAKRHFII